MGRFVNVRIPAEIDLALRNYTPSRLRGATAASARVRYVLLSYLHDHGSCLEMPREASPQRPTR